MRQIAFRFITMEKDGPESVMIVRSTSFKSAKRTVRRRLGKKEAKKWFLD